MHQRVGYGGSQRTKILLLHKPAIFAFSTKNRALLGYLNSILSISVTFDSTSVSKPDHLDRMRLYFPLVVQLGNFTTQLRVCNFNFATSTSS